MRQPVELEIEGMHCAACVARVEKALCGVPGVASASVNLATERARVELEQAVGLSQLIEAIEGTGFGAEALKKIGNLFVIFLDDFDGAEAAQESVAGFVYRRHAAFSKEL